MNNEDWFEISKDMLVETGSTPRKLKLCVDDNVPIGLVNKIRQMGIPAETAYNKNIHKNDDLTIISWVKEQDKILLTMDNDFWDDKKFPFQKIPGLILIEMSNENEEFAFTAFELIYETFARYVGNWKQIKIRGGRESYFLKGVSWNGGKFKYEVKILNGGLYAREI